MAFLVQVLNQSPNEVIGFSRDQLCWLSRVDHLRTILRACILEQCLDSVSLSEDDRRDAMQSFCSKHELNGIDEIEEFRRRRILSASGFEWLVERNLRYKLFCERNYSHAIKSRFFDRKSSLDLVVYSLIRVADPWLARELYLQIKEQEDDFASLAVQYSQGPENKTRGVVGPVPMTQPHPNLAKRLRTGRPGIVLEPFRVEQWWVVVRVESYTPAVFDDATSTKMASELFEEWLQEEVSRQMSKLSPQLLAIESSSECP